MGIENEVAGFVGQFRDCVQELWTDETAHPLYRPLPDAMSESYGQCIPASHILLPELRARFPQEHFALAGGRVMLLAGGVIRPAIVAHIWINWRRKVFSDTSVIDTTSDQAENIDLPPYIVKTYDRLREDGIIYQPYTMFENVVDFEEVFAQGEPAIRERIALLQRAFDQQKPAIRIK